MLRFLIIASGFSPVGRSSPSSIRVVYGGVDPTASFLEAPRPDPLILSLWPCVLALIPRTVVREADEVKVAGPLTCTGSFQVGMCGRGWLFL